MPWMKSPIQDCAVRKRLPVSSENITSVPSARPPSSKSPSAVDPLLDIRGLQVAYLTTHGPVKAVDGVSFQIQPGEVVGLAGESGSGKSTIAHAMLRILRPPALITAGQVIYKGVHDTLQMNDAELDQFRWRDISIVFQSAMNALNPVMKIRDQLLDVMLHHGMSKAEAQTNAERLFDLVGIEPKRL